MQTHDGRFGKGGKADHPLSSRSDKERLGTVFWESSHSSLIATIILVMGSGLVAWSLAPATLGR